MKMRLSVFVWAFALLGLFLTSCMPVQKKVEIPAEKIAYAGHGMLFDKEMNEIILDTSLITEIQDSMMDELLKAISKELPADTASTIQEAQGLLKSQKLSTGETILIKSGIIRTLLQDAPEILTTQYAWRNNALLAHYLSDHDELVTQLRPEVLEMLPQPESFEPVDADGDTPYMADCRLRGVPIPPDWAESGTPWVLQGTLTQNLLDPGGFAAVWTYSNPSARGACIALPRGNGSPGSAAGIICQSATGNACFWDNKRLGVNPEQFLGWSGQRLVISELKDGSNLNSACTQCHRGNNVFLMSPDDPTWAKLLRGSLSDPSTGTFTTQVESSSDNQGGHAVYSNNDIPKASRLGKYFFVRVCGSLP
jgi:hypothetical protein